MKDVRIQFRSGRYIEAVGEIDGYTLKVGENVTYVFNQNEVEYVEVEEVKD